MKTIKTIPTLMLAASLGAGMILVSEAALARNNDHQEHSDHQDRNGMGSYNGNGSATCSGRDSGATNKNEKSKPGPECQSAFKFDGGGAHCLIKNVTGELTVRSGAAI